MSEVPCDGSGQIPQTLGTTAQGVPVGVCYSCGQHLRLTERWRLPDHPRRHPDPPRRR